LLCFFWRWGAHELCPGWPQTLILLISASQVARIIGKKIFLIKLGSKYIINRKISNNSK
jgi:hypothetical protein